MVQSLVPGVTFEISEPPNEWRVAHQPEGRGQAGGRGGGRGTGRRGAPPLVSEAWIFHPGIGIFMYTAFGARIALGWDG